MASYSQEIDSQVFEVLRLIKALRNNATRDSIYAESVLSVSKSDTSTILHTVVANKYATKDEAGLYMLTAKGKHVFYGRDYDAVADKKSKNPKDIKLNKDEIQLLTAIFDYYNDLSDKPANKRFVSKVFSLVS